MANTVDKVINIALAEVGYLEKKNGNNLYDKTANAGSANYTKYGKEMHDIYPSVMDYPAYWCDAFVDWCFYKAYGVATAKSLLGGNFDDYTVNSAQMYKNKKAWYTSSPKVGDQIFFTNGSRICHTGIVYKVDSKKVYTIEGNTSGASGVVSNGGGVAKKSYSLGYAKIAGYGRPKYDVESSFSSSQTEKPVSNSTGKHVPLNYKVGTTYTVQCSALNVRTKKASQNVSVVPTGTVIGTKKKSNKVKCNATALVNGKIWMYIGLDSKKREQWVCADNGKEAYLA